MPGSNGYSTDPSLNNVTSQTYNPVLLGEENDDQEFYFLLNNLQKLAGRKLGSKQVNGLIQQWNSNQNGYRDLFRLMVLSKMGLQNTVNTLEISANKFRLDANKVSEGMTNVSKVNLLSTIRNRLPKLENFEKPIQKKSEDFKTNYWLSRALETNPNFKSIDDIKAWQLQNGLAADGKFGDKSLAKWNLLNSAPLPVEEAMQQLRGNGRLTVPVPEEAYAGNTSLGSSPINVKSADNNSNVIYTNAGTVYNPSTSGAAKLWNAVKGFGQWLAGPKEPIQTNTPVYGRKNIFMETGKAIHDTFGNANKHKNGGNINKFNNGGKPMNQKQMEEAFVQFLILDAQAHGVDPNDQQALLQYILSLGKEGLAAKQKEFMQRWEGTPSRKLGGHLAYLSKLKGNCPDGEEMVYMKEGGRVCPKCVKKAKEGKKVEEQKMNAILKFKAEKGIKVAKKDIDKKTYQNLPSNKKTEADEHYLGKATSDNKDGSYNISHKPNASDSTYIDRKHMSPNMQKKYPKKACGDKLVKRNK